MKSNQVGEYFNMYGEKKRGLLYALGYSLIAGHTYSKSFVNFAAEKRNIDVVKFAVNGATIMDIPSIGGQIIKQIELVSTQTPDIVLFDGGTNDMLFLVNHSESFREFEVEIEALILQLKERWPDSKLIYMFPHKMCSRDMKIQKTVHDICIRICHRHKLLVMDLFIRDVLDTRRVYDKNAYTFDQNNEEGLPGNGGSGTHPNISAIEKYYVPAFLDIFDKMRGKD